MDHACAGVRGWNDDTYDGSSKHQYNDVDKAQLLRSFSHDGPTLSLESIVREVYPEAEASHRERAEGRNADSQA
jgi:hypothetical protein